MAEPKSIRPRVLLHAGRCLFGNPHQYEHPYRTRPTRRAPAKTITRILASMLLASALHAQPGPAHDLRFTTPALRWDDAVPLGNGMLGALIWGNGRPLKISLDRADLWDLRLVPEFYSGEYNFTTLRRWKEDGRTTDIRRVYEAPYRRPAPTKIPAGRIEITLPGASFAGTGLSLANAEADVTFSSGAKVRAFVHAREPVGAIRVEGAREPAFRLVAPAFSGQVKEPARGGIAAGDLAQLGYSAPVESSGTGWSAYEQAGAEGFRFAVYLAWKRARNGWQAVWTVASSFEGADPLALARERVTRALDGGYEPLFASHRNWWRSYWLRSSITLPDPVLERQWYLEQYKFGSAARRGAPPITLQAVWTADDGGLPPWKGDYHHDLNTQLSYWPCYSGNHLEEGLGYLDWLWKTRDTAFNWTRRFFGLPGLNVPMTTDLNGNQIGGWVQYTHSATTAAWLAHHFYLHWRFSADRRFLEERAYPYLRDAGEFLAAYTAQRDARGRRTHPLSSSPEINDNRPDAWFDTVTNYDLALSRWLFTAAAELARELGLENEERRWLSIASELPDFALGSDGKLLVAAGQPLKASHRHFSHLMAIHPLGLIDWTDGAEAQRIIRASLADLEAHGTSMWCGYSFAWLGSLAARARDGERAAEALRIFSTAFTARSSFHVNGDQSGKGYSKFTYRPFTLEGNFAAAAGIQEMLLQSQRGVIRVFPAIPQSWANASFGTLRAEGAFLVSAEKAGGKVQRIEIMSEKGGRCRVALPWSGEEAVLEMHPGERRVLRHP